MVTFDFVKDAGEALPLAPSKGDPPADGRLAEAIRNRVRRLGLRAKELKIQVAGDTVNLSGVAPDQEIHEKIILAAGNVRGVARVEDDMSTEYGTPNSSFYTVVRGDTLWRVAALFYNDGTRYQTIYEANRPLLSDPENIFPGQLIRVPMD